MEIELVGTAAIYSKYNSACTLINEEMLVDVPNGTLKQLLKENHSIEKIDKILITHMHGDHTADIPFILMYLYKLKNIERKTTIIGPVGIKKKVEELFEAYDFHLLFKIQQYIDFIELKPKEILEIEKINYKIEAISVIHGKVEPAYGYIIDDILGITGDACLCDGVENIVKNSKIIVSDCSNIEGTETHMGIDNLKYLSEKYNKTILPTHLKDKTREELNNLNFSNILHVEDGYRMKI